MNILVTGSSGLIGSALVKRLMADGNRVTRLVRSGRVSRTTRPVTDSSTTSAGQSSPLVPITEVAWDPDRGTVDTVGLAGNGPYEGVVHLAGAGIGDRRWSPSRKELILRSRTEPTRLLVTTVLALDPRPPVLVGASAIGFYGDRGDELLTEASPRGSGFLSDVCAAWEDALAPATDGGIRAVSLRTGIVLAPEGGMLAKQLPLFRLGLGGRLGPGTQYQSWISLADQVGAIVHTLTDTAISGPVNAVAPNPVTNAGLTAALAHALHRPAVLAVPGTALRLALGREMADELVLSSQRVSPTVLARSGFSFGSPSIAATMADVVRPT